jgi:hypothetical protein
MASQARTEFFEFLVRDLSVLSSFCDVVVSPSEKARFAVLCNILVDFFESQGLSVKLLCWAITREIRQQVDASQGTLFRGSTIATQIIHAFLKNVGASYLKTLTAEVLSEISAVNNSFEVNPISGVSNNEIQQNVALLISIAKKFVAVLHANIDSCPLALRVVLSHVKYEVSRKYPMLCRVILSSILFLRFICPALVSPEEYNLVPNALRPNTKRGLVLLSKVMQNVANGIEFRQTEQHMQRFNSFIVENRRSLAEILDKLSDIKEIIKNDDFKKESEAAEMTDSGYDKSQDMNSELANYILARRSLWNVASQRIDEVYNILSLTIQQNLSKIEQSLIQNAKASTAVRLRQLVQKLNLKEENDNIRSSLQNKITTARNNLTNTLQSPSPSSSVPPATKTNTESREQTPAKSNTNNTSVCDSERSMTRELQTTAKLNAELAESNRQLLAKIEELQNERVTIDKMKEELLQEMTRMFNEMKASLSQEIKEYVLTTVRQDIVTLMRRVQTKTVDEVCAELENTPNDDNSKVVGKLDKKTNKISSEFSREIKIVKKRLAREQQRVELLEMRLDQLNEKKSSDEFSKTSSEFKKNNMSKERLDHRPIKDRSKRTPIKSSEQSTSPSHHHQRLPSVLSDSKENGQLVGRIVSSSPISPSTDAFNERLSSYLTSTSTRRKLPSILLRDGKLQTQLQQQLQTPEESKSPTHSHRQRRPQPSSQLQSPLRRPSQNWTQLPPPSHTQSPSPPQSRVLFPNNRQGDSNNESKAVTPSVLLSPLPPPPKLRPPNTPIDSPQPPPPSAVPHNVDSMELRNTRESSRQKKHHQHRHHHHHHHKAHRSRLLHDGSPDNERTAKENRSSKPNATN